MVHKGIYIFVDGSQGNARNGLAHMFKDLFRRRVITQGNNPLKYTIALMSCRKARLPA
jgi:hypothetical protein